MDQDHNPLLLEDVMAEEPPSLAEGKCLEVATAKAEGGRRGEGAVTATGALPPAPADAEAEVPEAATGVAVARVARNRATPVASMRKRLGISDLPGRAERDAGQRMTGFRVVA